MTNGQPSSSSKKKLLFPNTFTESKSHNSSQNNDSMTFIFYAVTDNYFKFFIDKLEGFIEQWYAYNKWKYLIKLKTRNTLDK